MRYKVGGKYMWGDAMVAVLSDQGNEAFVKVIKSKDLREVGIKRNVYWNELRPTSAKPLPIEPASTSFSQQSLPFGEMRSFKEFIEDH